MQDAIAAVAAAIAHATHALVSEGVLRQPAYPDPRVVQPTAKQRKALGSAVILTSPCAFAMAAADRKAAGVALPACKVHGAL
jgi:hypothetical protein